MSQEIQTSDDSFYDPLTKRELEILTLLAEGLSDHEIAQELHLALKTVKWYNSTQIYSKLGVKKRQDAVNKAQQLGLLVNVGGVTNRHNLPAQTTAFIGREQELSDLSSLLSNSDIRLLTLLAPGGMGKTRLALELAQQDLKNYSDGVFFIALAPLSSPSHVVMAIADALELHLQGEEELTEQVKQYIHDKQLLLILDNFEHILEAAPIITEILEVTTQVKVLATSREKLRLSGEKAYAISGMIFPDWETPEDALEYNAVKLFMQGAELASGEFQLDIDELKYLARICRLTEGMPLAIKLAAAWVDVLSLEEIAYETQASVDFLAAEMRDMPRRQWSIRAVFEPTWKRLTAEQQAVFMKFAVFRGGCTREAAQAITGATLRHLQTFVNKALLNRTSEGRYEIHELLRQYTEEQLLSANEAETTYKLHSRYFADFLNQREVDLKSHRQTETLQEIEDDFENIRYAWNRAIEQHNHRVLNQALESLSWYCLLGGHFLEGEALFQAALTSFEGKQEHEALALIWARLQMRLIYIQRWRHGNLEHRSQIESEIKKCLELAQSTDDATEIALCYNFLGEIARHRSYFDTAIAYYEKSLLRYQALEDRFNSAWTLHYMAGCTFYSGNSDKAIKYAHEALAIRRKIGDTFGMSMSLNNLAEYLLFRGDLSKAEQHIRETTRLSRNLPVEGWNMTLKGRIAFLQGDMETAKVMAQIGMDHSTQYSFLSMKLLSLSILGLVACVEGDFKQALRHWDEARMINTMASFKFYTNWLLSIISCSQGDIKTAIQASCDALAFPYKGHEMGRMNWCLPAFAIIEAQSGNTKRAVQILSLTFNHPNSTTGWLEKWSLISQLRQDLEAELGTEVYHQVWEQGKKLDLVAVTEELLAKYEENQA